MKTEFTRFDMKRPPIPSKWYLQALEWVLSAPATTRHQTVIKKIGTEDLKPPYLLLCNHNAFMDFKVATKVIFPHRANYVVAIDGFIGREELLRSIGCICKRKFTNDLTLIRQLKQVVENGNIAVIYPEARYSLCGTTAVLPASLGKLCKLLGVPVAVLICHGHHINSPFWNLHERGVAPTEAEFIRLYTAEELKDAKADEVNDKILAAFQYDDYSWQKDRNIRTPYPKRESWLRIAVQPSFPIFRTGMSGKERTCRKRLQPVPTVPGCCRSGWIPCRMPENSFTSVKAPWSMT